VQTGVQTTAQPWYLDICLKACTGAHSVPARKASVTAGLLTENRKPTCRIALGRTVDLFDVRKVDAGLGATLEKLAAAAGTSGSGGRGHAGPLTVDGVPIEDLCLAFVLPGYITVSVSNCLQSGT